MSSILKGQNNIKINTEADNETSFLKTLNFVLYLSNILAFSNVLVIYSKSKKTVFLAAVLFI